MNTEGLKKHMIETPLSEGNLDLIANTHLEKAYSQPRPELIESYEHTPSNSMDNTSRPSAPAPRFN